jgi:DNA-nicking Smr family endonuclease
MAKDLDLFRDAMAGVTPLKKGRAARPAAPVPRAERSPPPRENIAAPSAVAVRPVVRPVGRAATRPDPPVVQPFDREIGRALAKGKRAPEASLDLHGMTLVAAEKAVARFLSASAGQNLRLVLIVTGKGTRLEGGRMFGGRIRAEFPAWLERADNRALVAGVRAAHPRHGGSGAFYVLLRRRSSASSRSLRATPQR